MYLSVLAVTADDLDVFSLVAAYWYSKIAPVPVPHRSSGGVLQICIDPAGHQPIRPFGRHANDIGKDTGTVGNAHHRLSVFQDLSEQRGFIHGILDAFGDYKGLIRSVVFEQSGIFSDTPEPIEAYVPAIPYAKRDQRLIQAGIASP